MILINFSFAKYKMHLMSEEQNKPIIQKCEKCGKENETVHANFLLYGFMVCESCKISETLFPV